MASPPLKPENIQHFNQLKFLEICFDDNNAEAFKVLLRNNKSTLEYWYPICPISPKLLNECLTELLDEFGVNNTLISLVIEVEDKNLEHEHFVMVSHFRALKQLAICSLSMNGLLDEHRVLAPELNIIREYCVDLLAINLYGFASVNLQFLKDVHFFKGWNKPEALNFGGTGVTACDIREFEMEWRKHSAHRKLICFLNNRVLNQLKTCSTHSLFSFGGGDLSGGFRGWHTYSSFWHYPPIAIEARHPLPLA